MATFRANAPFNYFNSNLLPLDEDVTALLLITGKGTTIGTRSYSNSLTVDYWDRSSIFSSFYSSTLPGRTILGGRDFALSSDQKRLDGTINAITHFTDGEPTSAYIIEGLKVSATDLANAWALSPDTAFSLLFSGNDRVVLSTGSDSIVTGAGNDTVVAGGGNDRVQAGSGDDVVQGNAGDDQLYGDDGNDSLSGGSGNDVLFGGAGNDLVDGGSGRDTFSLDGFFGGSAKVDLRLTGPQLIGGFGRSTLISIESLAGSFGRDTLIGNNQANTLQGNGDNDILIGNGGNDWLIADGGRDTLTGGSGADRFHLTELGEIEITRDKITDFSRAEGDHIVLQSYAVTGLFTRRPMTLEFANFYAAPGATKAKDASDRIIYNTATGILYFDPDGVGGGKTAFTIAELTNADGTHPALSYTDFLLI